jgi:hypothetical protein
MQMRSTHPDKVIIRREGWTVDLRATAILGIVLASVFVFIFFFRRAQEAQRSRTQGTIQEIRIVPDHAIETKWGGTLTWKAEYRVAYSVSDHEYELWADSGLRGDSEASVRLALLPHPRHSCQVQYYSHKPEVSTADCR